MLRGSCHCGDVQLELPALPAWRIDCNCSICRRTGAQWALWDPAAVRVHGHPAHTTAYVWGARTIRTLRCSRCGCVTHWEPLVPAAGTRIGVNLRNFDPAALAGVPTRRFDGAETWAYLDPE